MTDVRKDECRGRGRGRGLNRSSLGNFKPKECLITADDIISSKNFNDDVDKGIENIVIEAKDASNNIQKISEEIAANYLTGEIETFNEINATGSNKLSSQECTSKAQGDPLISENILLENNENSIIGSDDNINVVLKKAVSAPEFIPKSLWSFTSTDLVQNSETLNDQSTIVDNGFTNPNLVTEDDDQETLNVLKSIIYDLTHNPFSFEDICENLTEYLIHFCTLEKTLNQVVNMIVDQALDCLNFQYFGAKLCYHFDKTKGIDLKNGVTFRSIFLRRCQDDYKKIENLFKATDKDPALVEKISNYAIWFGELLVIMKINGDFNPVFKKAVFSFVDMFLESGDEKMLLSLTQLLKLVGPELDKDRPKEVEAMFEKLKAFYFDAKNEHIDKNVKEKIWKVYKLFTRNWDRPLSPLASPSVTKIHKPVFFPSSSVEPNNKEANISTPATHHASTPIVKTSSSKPVDWNEYYCGDDNELNDYFGESSFDDEALGDDASYYETLDYEAFDYEASDYEAYDEFLKQTGQL